MRVLLIGKSSGRLDCLAEAIRASEKIELFILTNLVHEGLTDKGFVTVGPTDDPEWVADYALKYCTAKGVATIAVVSNEEPLAAGVADALHNIGIETVGPTRALAQIESSKTFTRNLLDKNKLAYMNPLWGSFEPGEINRVRSYMHAFKHFVIKPDGLTGGKGVKVLGDHFQTVQEGLDYCNEIFEQGGRLLIEQQQFGQEFSLMSFSDGKTVIDMPLVQDHKRLLDLDQGPNTGGMGSYSMADHRLPICDEYSFQHSRWANRKVIEFLQAEIGQPYKGIIYGNYIITSMGLKIIEFNCRFGDPEVMNVLPILETDFGEILFSITTGRLTPKMVQFAPKATVVKYLVPIGHPTEPEAGEIDLSAVQVDKHTRLYRGALDGNQLTGSRAAAVVGIHEDIYMAEKFAEYEAMQVKGPLFHRKDIGTYEAIERRINNVSAVRGWQ
jgi:phosphoribosylamine--glycine ligase